MARGTVLAEILLEGDRTFRRAVESSGDQMDDAARDATELSGALGFAGNRLDAVRDDALGLASSLQLLQGRADEAGDEIAQAGRRATATSGMFSTLALTSDGVAVSFGRLSGITALSLVPSLFALSSALVPLVSMLGLLAGGAVALTGAFGAVIGLGVAGNFQAVKQAFTETRDALWPFVKLVGEQFTPLVLDAIDALRELGFEVLAIVGDRAGEFTDSLRSLGAAVADVIPGLVDGFFDLAELALPVFEDFVRFLQANGDDILSGLKESAMSVAPVLRDLLDATIAFLPEFSEFGSTVARVVIPALTDLMEFGTDVLRWVNSLDPQLQTLIATGSVLAPVIAKIGTALIGLSGPIGLIAGGIAALALAWESNFGNIRGVVSQLGQDVQQVLGDRLPTLIRELKQLFRTILPIIEPIFNTLLNIAGEFVVRGLDVVLSTLTALVQLLNGDVSGAMETMGRLMIRVGNSVLQVVTMVAEGIVNAVIQAVNQLSRVINDRLVASLPEDVQKAVGEDPFVQNIGAVDFQAPQIPGGRTPVTGQQTDQSRQKDRRVVLELKGELADMVRPVANEEATNVVVKQQRVHDRRRGQPSPYQ